MNKTLIFLCIAATLLASDLHAQTSAAAAVSPTPPQMPLIKRAPDKVLWVITYKQEPDAASLAGAADQSGKHAKKREVIKSQDTIFERTLNENGVTMDTWHIPPGLVMTAVKGGEWTLAFPGQPGFDTADYSSQDFAGFDWISQQNFTGVTTVNGRRCLVFQGRVVTLEQSELSAISSDIARDLTWADLPDEKGGSKPKPSEPRLKPQQRFFNIEDYKSPVAAYIDEETRLPVALVYKTPAGTMTRTYEFRAAPALVPPPDLQKALESYKEREKRLSVARAPV